MTEKPEDVKVGPRVALDGALAGRTVQVVSDLSQQEQLYLYERARRLKARSRGLPQGGGAQAPPLCEVQDADVDERVNAMNATVYLLFMEGSTRTRESLRNAGIFHGVKMNEFQAETSSFQKNETMADTMKMLSVYSTDRSIFVIRSPLEGVCSWLETVIPRHTEKFGIPKPAFLNAGDGRFTHPIGEMLDVFSLLESCQWDRSSIHLALVGDLANGRTAHTKVDGLKIFERVRVDLVSPEAFEYPVEYRNRMQENGFEVREFSSIEEYLDKASDSLATSWYFYKPKMKSVGEISEKAARGLYDKVTFKQEWKARLPESACFFQTLPRNKENPLVPLAFDNTSLNGWDRVANNAYSLHVILLSMLFGKIGRGLERDATDPVSNLKGIRSGADLQKLHPLVAGGGRGGGVRLPDFIEEYDLQQPRTRRPSRAEGGGAIPLADGLVIDHIGVSDDPAECWRTLRRMRMILGWTKYLGGEGVFPSKRGQHKGIMSFPNFEFEKVSVPHMKVLASVSPGCTVNAIADSKVVAKYRLSVPQRVYNLPNIHCKNKLCISNPQNAQRDAVAYFDRVPFYETSALPGGYKSDYLFVCKYCRWPHMHADIWADAASDAARFAHHLGA